MSTDSTHPTDAGTDQPTALIVGASRGLGAGLAAEFADRGWRVIGTVRGAERTPLHDLAEKSGGAVTVETLDMTEPEQLLALRHRLSGTTLDLLFVNGAVARGDVRAADVETGTFVDVMVTNALSPLRVIDTLGDLVAGDGTVGVMSSTQGSVSLNTKGGQDVYRASKSALNQLMRCYAAREPERSALLINPGHVQTELGGSGAQLTVSDTVPGIVDTILAHRGAAGLQFLDWRGQSVPW